tara:strand:+ start:442 stop:960 length:519 start_codon:yes stop_codon:yes gene_type:complete
MKIKILPIFTITFFSIIFFVFYKGLQNSNIYVPEVKISKNVPNFEANIFDTNKKISSKKLFEKDKFYIVNIWSSWCIPCKDEHPFLINLKNSKNTEIIGLNYKDKDENAKFFLQQLGNPYKVILSDKNGTLAIEWGAYGVPESFLVYNNKIIKKITGPLNTQTLAEIKGLLK